MINKTDFRNVLIISILTVLCLIPFANKAVHIDDPLFLWNARHILEHPFDFYGSSVNWYGYEMPMAQVTKNPPLASYYIASIAWLFGWKELFMHIAFLLPALASSIGIYALAKKFCLNPLLATLIGILSPLFLVSSSTLMCDTMMLAFYVWAVVLWIEGLQRWLDSQRSAGYLFISAILIAFCGLTKYFGIALFPLLIIYSIMKTKKLASWIWPLLIPVIMWSAYQWGTSLIYGKGLLLDAVYYAGIQQSVGAESIFHKMITTLSFAGGGLIGVLFFSTAIWNKHGVLIMGAIIGSALVIGHLTQSWYNTQLIIFCGTGAIIIYLAFIDLFWKRNAEASLLALWLLGTILFTGLTNWTINSRSLLPLVPIFGILVVRAINISTISLHQYWLLLPALIIALAVTWADTSLADSAKQAVTQIQKLNKTTTGKTYFQGHWGFQYYMQEAGFTPLDFKSPQVVRGDLIVIPKNNTNCVILPENLVEYEQTLIIPTLPWLSTFKKELQAGFYASLWGQLPYAFGTVPPEEYRIYSVKVSAR